MSQVDRGRLGRNDPCWCKSGAKYKNCHLNRSEQERSPYHKFAKDLKKTREGEQQCLYPLSTGACTNTVIRAHSISRNAALARVARNGHVYQWNFDPFEIQKKQGEIAHSLVGINSATTFTGFCSPHDQSLFKPIDIGVLAPSPEQVFLLHYRALCRELYVKRTTLASNSALREADRGQSAEFQSMLQTVISGQEESILTALNELDTEKAICDGLLQTMTYTDIRALILHFDKVPTIACSGHTQPIFDFAGNEIQDLADMAKPLAKLSFTLLPSGNGGIGVISWLNDSEIICRKFANSLLALSDESKCSALVQWVFDSFENHALEPQWWETLSDAKRGALELISLNWTSMMPLDSGSLVPTGSTFADWEFRSFAWM